MKNFTIFLLVLSCVLIVGCNAKNDKDVFTSKIADVNDAAHIVKIKKSAHSLDEMPSFIVGNDGCYWALGEYKKSSTVAVQKVVRSNGEQLCLPKELLEKPNSTTLNSNDAATEKDVVVCLEFNMKSVKPNACPAGTKGNAFEITESKKVNNKCFTSISLDTSSCIPDSPGK